MWTPRARAATSARGESAAPDGQQRRTTAARLRSQRERSRRPPRLRHGDDEVERPDPARQGDVAPHRHRHRGSRLGEQVEDVADDRRATERRHEHRPGPLAARHALDAALGRQRDGLADLRAGRGESAQRLARVERGDGLLAVDA